MRLWAVLFWLALWQTAAMLDRLLRAVPVWKLVNRGDEASARLTHDTLCGKENV